MFLNNFIVYLFFPLTMMIGHLTTTETCVNFCHIENYCILQCSSEVCFFQCMNWVRNVVSLFIRVFCPSSLACLQMTIFFRFVYFSFLLFHLSLIHRVSGSYENTGKVLNRFVPSSSSPSPPPTSLFPSGDLSLSFSRHVFLPGI